MTSSLLPMVASCRWCFARSLSRVPLAARPTPQDLPTAQISSGVVTATSTALHSRRLLCALRRRREHALKVLSERHRSQVSRGMMLPKSLSSYAPRANFIDSLLCEQSMRVARVPKSESRRRTYGSVSSRRLQPASKTRRDPSCVGDGSSRAAKDEFDRELSERDASAEGE